MRKAKIVKSKTKNKAYHGTMPPNPYTQNDKYYKRYQKKPKSPSGPIPIDILLNRIKYTILLSPLILALYVLVFKVL